MVYVKYKLFQELNDKLNEFGADNWEVIYYQENKPKEWGSEHEAKILFKKQKN